MTRRFFFGLIPALLAAAKWPMEKLRGVPHISGVLTDDGIWSGDTQARFAWGQGLVDFDGCCELPTPGRIFIDGRESDEWIDFVDLKTLEYRIIFRNSRGDTFLTRDGRDVIRYNVVAHSSITIIDADGTEWSSNHV